MMTSRGVTDRAGTVGMITMKGTVALLVLLSACVPALGSEGYFEDRYVLQTYTS